MFIYGNVLSFACVSESLFIGVFISIVINNLDKHVFVFVVKLKLGEKDYTFLFQAH